MARESTTGPEHRPRAANDDHQDDDGEDAGSVQQTTIPTEINYPKLPRTSLTAGEDRRDSFYVCEENNADGDEGEEDGDGDDENEEREDLDEDQGMQSRAK